MIREALYTTLDGSLRRAIVSSVRIARNGLYVRFENSPRGTTLKPSSNINTFSTGRATYRSDGSRWWREKPA